MTPRTLLPSVALLVAAVSLAGSAGAAEPYVVLTDDGTIEMHALVTLSDEKVIEAKLLELYAAAGQPLPEFLSVWSTFPLGGSPYGTYFDPIGAGVKGIGLQADYPPDGTLPSPEPPLQSILFHNDVTQLAARAALQSADEAGFARYLFLLELSHNWGPALQVPSPNGGDLVGFPFHWSFFMDAGGSPAGGNVWTDNGDGTFTASAEKPSTIAYSMLDLYIMGLATPDEVKPFGVLENVVVPASPTDPLWQGAYAAHSFPWFDASSSLTVQATRRTITIDDVIATNGARDPAAGAGPTTHTLGIVLLVSENDDAAAIASARATFSPIAESFAPAFHDATAGRGTLQVVTSDAPPGSGGAGGGGDASGSGGGAAGTGGSAADGGSTVTGAATSGAGGAEPTTDGGAAEGGGCSVPAGGEAPPIAAALGLLGALGALRLRQRANRRPPAVRLR